MKKIFLLIVFILLIMFLVSCKGVGIFSYIAITEKIETGLLPEGIGATGIFQIKNEYSTTHYDYFSSGSALYRRKTLDRSKPSEFRWSAVSLPSGWTNIQSIAASDSKLYLALASSSDTGLNIGLFTYTNADSFSPITDNDSVFSSTGGYKTLLLYCPNPSATTDALYVNVLEYSGTFAKDTSTFSGSKLYLLAASATQIASNDEQIGTWTTTLEKSYISSIAYSGTTTRVTTIQPDSDSPTGKLVDATGKQTSGTILDTDGNATGDTSPPLPSGALTWLPHLNAFLMASRTTDAGSYKIYISTDGATGNSWRTLNSAYYLTCFLDVSNTRAGGKAPLTTEDYTPPDILILTGTRTTTSTTSGYGYLEIVASDDNGALSPEDWTLRTSKNSFTFAQPNSYIAGDLSSSSVAALTLLPEISSGDQYVYASTFNSGIWRINADDNADLLANTLIWSGE